MTDARRITEGLGGRWRGRYGVALCPAHDNRRTPALSLGDGRDGRLLVKCHAGCDPRDVLAALRGSGLLDGAGRTYAPDPAAEARWRAAETTRREAGTALARRILAAADPAAGTLAERYLRARGLFTPPPPSLRFAPALRHPGGASLPAMVAAVELAGEAAPVAAHRTYLAEPGRKANADPAKAMLGPCAGGAVRLADGPGALIVAEGIETTLALAPLAAAEGARLWAALSALGMASLRLPADPGALVVAPDGDPAGMGAAETLAARARAAGWSARIMAPPGDGRDWADVAADLGRGAAA